MPAAIENTGPKDGKGEGGTKQRRRARGARPLPTLGKDDPFRVYSVEPPIDRPGSTKNTPRTKPKVGTGSPRRKEYLSRFTMLGRVST